MDEVSKPSHKMNWVAENNASALAHLQNLLNFINQLNRLNLRSDFNSPNGVICTNLARTTQILEQLNVNGQSVIGAYINIMDSYLFSRILNLGQARGCARVHRLHPMNQNYAIEMIRIAGFGCCCHQNCQNGVNLIGIVVDLGQVFPGLESRYGCVFSCKPHSPTPNYGVKELQIGQIIYMFHPHFNSMEEDVEAIENEDSNEGLAME